ncbi:hypothetical protein DK867_02570 [Ochrobactrum sp. POC9]|uniref:hypothetical protein n=1 Tax=Ochrobactrum sp. POC9 TaxID=2203419 RepID=UPI000D70695D|nr:hypothetical protein [Ochrobactrum sp. POC9]PWU76174.1 hypothetical protein DK867_02570 [Ochrobactrum sp. POC9]
MTDKQTVKVGDKVRCLVTQLDVREEATYEVKTVDFDGGIWVTDDVGDRFYLTTDEYEPLPIANATGKPAFKVGDRVRVIRDGSSPKGSGHGANIGHTFTVSIDEDGDITDGEWFFYPDELSLCEELTPLTIETGKFYRTRDGRKVGPMGAWYDDGSCFNSTDYLNGGLWKPNGEAYFSKAKDSPTLIAEWGDESASNDNAPLTTPAIVALIQDGQPKPSEQPKVHKSEQAATDEAERLAVKYPGQKFGVFVLADSRIADVVIRRAA